MAQLRDFAMERWQSRFENQVTYNLSESGVHPVTVRELLELAELDTLADVRIGYGQSNGTPELRARIAALYAGAETEHIVVTNGSAEANFAVLWHLVEPGDDVVILMPAYMQASGLVESLGARIREVWLREAEGWQPRVEDIEAAVTERTRIIIVTNPNNPTGVALTDAARHALLHAAERVGAWILADEVYTGAEIGGVETPTFWQPDRRVIATGSLSKAYGLPGLRIGWAVLPRSLSEPVWARKDYTTIGPGALTDQLAFLALDARVRPRLLARTRRYIETGLELLTDWLTRMKVFQYRRPDAGAILFAHYDLPVTADDLVERLRTRHSLLIVPGTHFHMDSYLRFGFGLPAPELARALAEFETCIRSLAVAAPT